ncbi:enteropeptidase-like [Oppia nitens]|uniref:enteropeptidase-like n=1 Tax=Oppia nitens TaxID=1686743 RepID=UPI0023DC4258|nr:enteropeptidase-like [Oppia nitens]
MKTNDIALIELSEPLYLKKHHGYLKAVSMPKQNQILSPRLHCVATGWGRVKFDGQTSKILQEVVLPIFDGNKCEQIWKDLSLNKNYQICGGYELDETYHTCEGDSGGPLNCQLDTGAWVIAGINSYGYDCGKDGVPDVFTRVSGYRQWIDDNMKPKKNYFKK